MHVLRPKTGEKKQKKRIFNLYLYKLITRRTPNSCHLITLVALAFSSKRHHARIESRTFDYRQKYLSFLLTLSKNHRTVSFLQQGKTISTDHIGRVISTCPVSNFLWKRLQWPSFLLRSVERNGAQRGYCRRTKRPRHGVMVARLLEVRVIGYLSGVDRSKPWVEACQVRRPSTRLSRASFSPLGDPRGFGFQDAQQGCIIVYKHTHF